MGGAMRRLFFWLTGGRPMRRVGFAFTDVVSGDAVYVMEDTYGRLWLAEGPWGSVRVETRGRHWLDKPRAVERD